MIFLEGILILANFSLVPCSHTISLPLYNATTSWIGKHSHICKTMSMLGIALLFCVLCCFRLCRIWTCVYPPHSSSTWRFGCRLGSLSLGYCVRLPVVSFRLGWWRLVVKRFDLGRLRICRVMLRAGENSPHAQGGHLPIACQDRSHERGGLPLYLSRLVGFGFSYPPPYLLHQ